MVEPSAYMACAISFCCVAGFKDKEVRGLVGSGEFRRQREVRRAQQVECAAEKKHGLAFLHFPEGRFRQRLRADGEQQDDAQKYLFHAPAPLLRS